MIIEQSDLDRQAKDVSKVKDVEQIARYDKMVNEIVAVFEDNDATGSEQATVISTIVANFVAGAQDPQSVQSALFDLILFGIESRTKKQ